MRLLFLGVGEACDAAHGNTSILLTTTKGTSLLLDCGFSVPHRFFGHCSEANELDGLWVSHFHGDHCFGTPLLLLRFWEMGRTKPLTVIGQPGTKERLLTLLELAYPGFRERLCFDLDFLALEPGCEERFKDLCLNCAETIHSERNLGLCLDDGQRRVYYSGDGRASQEAARLMTGCDLLIHEAFKLEDTVDNHGSVQSCLGLLESCPQASLALVHMERTFRRQIEEGLVPLPDRAGRLLLPDDGVEMVVPGAGQT